MTTVSAALPTAAGLAYTRRGTGPTLLLLHGLGESSVGWQPVLPALAEHHDVIALDLPGFGESPALPADILPTAAALADSVERALDELGIDQCHIAGYSLGARVALALGARGRARSIVVIATDGLGTPAERLQQAAALTARRILTRALVPWASDVSMTPAGRYLVFTPDRLHPSLLTAAEAHRLLADFATAPGYEAAVAAGVVDVPPGLERIGAPVLILQGTHDPLVSLQAPRFLAVLPNAKLRWLPGLSHVPISDNPEAIARLLLDFFGRT